MLCWRVSGGSCKSKALAEVFEFDERESLGEDVGELILCRTIIE
jgi:hypothetical protein